MFGCLGAQDLKVGECMFAAFMTNDLLWSVWPVCCDGEFDRASVFRQFSPQNSVYSFLSDGAEIVGPAPRGSPCALEPP